MRNMCVGDDIAYLSPKMKIFELIDSNNSLLSIFSRLNIKLPFGDMSIEELCQRDGYSHELFIMLCRMHISSSYRPSHDEFSSEMLPQVIHYLRATHNYYIDYMLPHAEKHLEEILAYCDTLSNKQLRRFYGDYVRCIEEHLKQEEDTLFTAIDSGMSACRAQKFDLDMPHTDIDDRTSDIASLIIKYLPEEAPTQLRCAMLKDIYSLRDDLRRHAAVEMYLLKPLMDKFLKCDQQ